MRAAVQFCASGGLVSAASEGEGSVVMSSEESSTYPDSSGLDLGLGLSLGCGDGGKGKIKMAAAVIGGDSLEQYERMLTVEGFKSLMRDRASSLSSESSSSSSFNKVNNNGCCGTKRAAASPSSPPGRSSVSQVVGWPPVRTAYRMSSLVNHAKSPVTKDFFSAVKTRTDSNHNGNTNDTVKKEKRPHKTSLFVKVNMDGIPIGRKVDLSAHRNYETLVHALDDMFKLSTAMGSRRSHMAEHAVLSGRRQSLNLLDGSFDFVLTYEDKDGDWMLVGDVPWNLFLNSVRRLQIMRTAKANGLGSHGRNRTQQL
ncbi:auxin-responsive protein IAA11-like [Andrographis paniculata]|uniref:auxin-responsive protein IAA11-like n=1 Tax=Andrographis paniculata TaxID=175694 RepID=UPI0021E89D5D|nr:auxin-responsive protein IAA11-like [Andrographis paniculata]